MFVVCTGQDAAEEEFLKIGRFRKSAKESVSLSGRKEKRECVCSRREGERKEEV